MTKFKRGSKKNVNHVRIIGGQHKRRQVGFIDANGLRPTPDRVRETVFNWLSPHLSAACVLDVCAGSGVLGFESLSRGAASCTFIELHRDQVAQLCTSADTLGLQTTYHTYQPKDAKQAGDLKQVRWPVSIYHGDALQVLPQISQSQTSIRFDVVFVDPPYHLQLWQPVLKRLIDHQLLADAAVLYIEADRSLDDLGVSVEVLQPFTLVKEKKMGNVHCHLLRYDHFRL